MRRWVWAALFAIALVLLFFLYPSSEQKEQQPGAPPDLGPVHFSIRTAELADSSSSQMAVMRLSLSSEGREGQIRAWCSPNTVQRSVLLLEHPAVPGADATLEEKIGKELGRCGLSFRKAGVPEALSASDSVIISTAGAVPLELLENAKNLSAANNRVIVLELLPGRAIDRKGKITPANKSNAIETIGMSVGNASSGANEAALRALFPRGALKFEALEGASTIAIAASSNRTSCRVVYLGEDGSCRFVDTGELVPPPGTLSGRGGISAGGNAVLEFSLLGKGEVGRNLEFYASVDGEGGEISRQEVGGGNISEGWASRFAVQLPQGGDYVVRVFDQFGRQHAAFLDIAPTLEAPIIIIEIILADAKFPHACMNTI